MTDIFFLDPEYQKLTDSRQLKFSTMGVGDLYELGCVSLTILFFIPMILLMLFLVNYATNGDILLSLGVFGCLLLFGIIAILDIPWYIARYVVGRHRYARITRTGQRLKGEIVSVMGERRGNQNHYEVDVIYRFTTPAGKVLSRKQSNYREDLFDTDLPSAGTPVWVLYANDNAHVML